MGNWIVCAMCIISCAGPPPEGESAQALADQIIARMGGEETLARKRFLRFDFVVKRAQVEVARHAHLWDRWHGRYRIEGITKDGIKYAVLFTDIAKQTGRVWINDSVASNDHGSEFLEYGYGRYINDTYWLLMPWKVRDAGVRLSLKGKMVDTAEGTAYDILHLSFDSVGLTPKDQYWAFVNSTTGLIDRWKYVLDGDSSKTGDFFWTSWNSYDGVWFSSRKTSVDTNTEILHDKLRWLYSVEDRVFQDPTVPLP